VSGDVLREVLAVLDEVKRLDDRQVERSRRLQELAKRARTPTTPAERAEAQRQSASEVVAVVDYGDVWEQIKALRPKVQKALKSLPVEPCG
jgi:hypothetical protein